MPTIKTEDLFKAKPSKTISSEELFRGEVKKPTQTITTEGLLAGSPSPEGTFSKMSRFNKTIDIIGRPGYAIKSIFAETEKMRQERISGGLTPELNPLEFEEINKSSVRKLKAAWRGFSGKERVTANELWGQVGVKDVPLLGFATEVLLDPLMYGGYSAIMRGGGMVVGGTAKLAMKIPPVKAGVTKVGEAVKPIARLFLEKSRIPELNVLIDKWLSERRWLMGREVKYAAQTRLAVRSTARKGGRTPKEEGVRIANIIELRYHPEELSKVVPNIMPEERVLANTLQGHYTHLIVEEMKHGIAISPLSSVRSTKIAKLQKNLEVVRTAYSKDLTRTRAKLVKELDVYADGRLSEYTKRLTKKGEVIEEAAYKSNVAGIKRINSLIDGVDEKMRLLEKMRVRAVKDQAPRTLKDIDKQLDKLSNQYWYLHSEMAERLQGIPELRKGTVFTQQLDDISNLLAADIEINLGRKGVSLAKQVMATEEKIGKLPQTGAGIPKGEARKLLKSLTVERGKREFGYFPRITTDEAKKIILSMRIGRTKIWTPEMMNALKRRTSDFTVEEFNEFVRSFGLTSLQGRTIEQFFLTDPAYATAIRGTRSAKAITSAEFLKEAGGKFGMPIKESPSNYILLPDHIIKLNPSLKGQAFPEELASEIGRATSFYFNPEYRPDVWSKFLKHFDEVQNLWKRWQLAIFPKYHLRNAVGNVWNNFLADVNPVYYPQAAALQAYRKYRHVPYKGDVAKRQLYKLGITTDDASRYINEAERLGVLEAGWFSADIDYSVTRSLGKGGISGRGMAFGRTIENNARLAHYLDRVVGRKTSPMEAALSTKKFLFDYSDLTQFERSVLKRLAPFYTWTRKNIPLQLEMLYKTPEKFAPLAVPMRTREPQDLLRLKYASPRLYNRLPIELQRTIDTVTYIPLEGVIPSADLLKLARPQDIVVDLLSPFIKEPIEQVFNKNIYFNRPIESYRGQTRPFLGVDMPVRIRHLLTTVFPSARITREIDKIVTKQKNRIPLNAIEWAFASSLSTVYKMDLEELRKRAVFKMQKTMDELSKGAFKAKRDERDKEFKAIRAEMERVKTELRGIL